MKEVVVEVSVDPNRCQIIEVSVDSTAQDKGGHGVIEVNFNPTEVSVEK